jgi:hypothetical protein
LVSPPLPLTPPKSVTCAPAVSKTPPPAPSENGRAETSRLPLVNVRVPIDTASPSDTAPAAAPSAASAPIEIPPPPKTDVPPA